MGWVLEIDIRSYFDKIVRATLVEMIEKRVTDGSVLRLIWKWIKVGVIEDGTRRMVRGGGKAPAERGSLRDPVRRRCHPVLPAQGGRGKGVEGFTEAVREVRFDSAPEKTRLMEFGRYAMGNAKKQGKKPETFDFLGFTHICTRSRRGKFTVHVKTVAK